MLLKEKEKINDWLNEYGIINYELIKDKKYGYVVNVFEDVELSYKGFKCIEVKFNEIEGGFNCSYNKLKELEGSPEIVNGYFDCSFNNLKNLIEGPKFVKGNYYCNNNELISLNGSPLIINKSLSCYNNNLMTLKGGPEIIKETLDCSHNFLTIENFKGLKLEIYELLDIVENKELGELQNILDFNLLKEKIDKLLKIKEEKENLLNIINKEKLNKKSNVNKI